jgi:hypothetical protein
MDDTPLSGGFSILSRGIILLNRGIILLNRGNVTGCILLWRGGGYPAWLYTSLGGRGVSCLAVYFFRGEGEFYLADRTPIKREENRDGVQT